MSMLKDEMCHTVCKVAFSCLSYLEHIIIAAIQEAYCMSVSPLNISLSHSQIKHVRSGIGPKTLKNRCVSNPECSEF